MNIHSTSESQGAAIKSLLELRSAVRRVFRFLGFTKINVVYPSSDMPRPHLSEDKDRPELSTRQIMANDQAPKMKALDIDHRSVAHSLVDNLEGFRATTSNLSQIRDAIVTLNVGRLPGQPDEAYLARIEMFMVLAGLGELDQKTGQLISLSHRFLQPSIEASHLKHLASLMTRPSTELRETEDFKGFGQSILQSVLEFELDSQQAAQKKFYHVVSYLDVALSPEMMDNTGENPALISHFLPQLPPANLDEAYRDTLNTTIKKVDVVTPTDPDMVENNCRPHNIAFIKGKKTINFDDQDIHHQSLVLLHYITSAFSASMTSRVAFAGEHFDDQKAQDDRLISTGQFNHTVSVTHHLTHKIIKQSMPEQFAQGREGASFSYQHTLLVGPTGKCLWNSDDVQPRGGWKDLKPLQTLKQ